jgi:putative aldouronate transport system substrate-binding protein
MKQSKWVLVLLTGVLGSTAIVGCSGSSANTDGNQASPEGSKEPAALTWYTNGKTTAKLIKSLNDMESYKEIQKRTNTKITFQEAADNTQFNIMLASGTYPDIMYVPGNYPGGLTKLVEDGVVIKLNDLIDKHAPNFKKILDENPNVKKQIMLDDGTIAKFPEIALDLRRNAWSGHLIRQDWLDKVGMKAPVTIDDWYQVLKAFKEKDPNGNGKADEIPLGDTSNTGSLNSFSNAFGVLFGFQLQAGTGKITYGPYEPAFKDYLRTMRKWYQEGLFDSEFAATDQKAFDAKFANNTIGAYGGTITGINSYKDVLKSTVPDFNLIGVTPPIGPAGKPYSQSTRLVQNVPLEGVTISSQCKDPVAAVKLLDFMIGPEGSDLQNWGIEGVTYTVENGQKKYTDLIFKNPDGHLPRDIIYKYAHPTNGMAQVFDFNAWAAFELLQPEQAKANERWFKADPGLLLPPLQFKGNESQEISSIMSEVDTYVKEMRVKFVMGNEPIDGFDKFQSTLKKMNIETAMKHYQAAYDRYQAKK